jgi:RimJ/RimL family protein N-acetyltransferase
MGLSEIPAEIPASVSANIETGTEISLLFLGIGFEILGLPAIGAPCDPANLASRRAPAKSGPWAGTTTAETERIIELERENREWAIIGV